MPAVAVRRRKYVTVYVLFGLVCGLFGFAFLYWTIGVYLLLNVCYNSSLDKTVFSFILVILSCVIVGFVSSLVDLTLEYGTNWVWFVRFGLRAGMWKEV